MQLQEKKTFLRKLNKKNQKSQNNIMTWKSLKFPLTTAQRCRVSAVVVSPTIIRNMYRVKSSQCPLLLRGGGDRCREQISLFTVHHVYVTTELCSTDLLESENSRYSPEKSSDHNDGKECRPDDCPQDKLSTHSV